MKLNFIVNLFLSNRLVRDVWDEENLNFKDIIYIYMQGRIQDFKLVFRVKIHDFTPIKQITESPSYP